jgi:integrase
MKCPMPFYRSAKGAWYVQLRDGRQKSLGKHPVNLPQPKRSKDGEWNPPDAVMKEYHKVMLHEDTGPVQAEFTVGEVFDLYLDYCQQQTASYELYSYFLNDADKSFGTLKLSELKPFHLTRWVNKHGSWGETTRHMVITVVKAAINYGLREGYVESNPIRFMTMPTPESRDRILSPEEWQNILGSIKDPCFRDYLVALRESGARPGEVAQLKPENVDVELGIWVLKKHKTKKKTRQDRVIYCSPALVELTKQRLAITAPGQYLFQNTKGNKWTKSSLYFRFETLRKKFPELEDVVPYTLRASFATDALEAGVPEATVSELLGHRDTRMLHKHYSKLSKKVAHLREAAAKASGGCAVGA